MTKDIAKPLDSLERTTLRNCEKTIEKGCQTFLDVGRALMQVRTENLYRETHKTFKAYCENRWGFTDRRARQLMEGAEVVDNVKSGTTCSGSSGRSSGAKGGEGVAVVTPSHESQTRPLAKLPGAQQATAWRDAVEKADGEQPTAAQVQEAVDTYIEEDEDEEPDEDAPLPDEPEEVSIGDIVDAHNKAIESFCRRIKTAAKQQPEVAWLEHKGRWDGYLRKVTQGLDTLRSAKAVVCPACNGEGCKECEDYGFLPKIEAEGIST